MDVSFKAFNVSDIMLPWELYRLQYIFSFLLYNEDSFEERNENSTSLFLGNMM